MQELSLFEFYKKIVRDSLALKEELKAIEKSGLEEETIVERIPQLETQNESEGDLPKNCLEGDITIAESINQPEPYNESERDLANDETNLSENLHFASVVNIQTTPVKYCNQEIIPSSSKDSAANEYIPSPFKRVLFWPEPRESKKKRAVKEKIPSVVTSKHWQLYYESKQAKKEEEEKKKKMRAQERQQKKEIKQKLKEQKKGARKRKCSKK